MSQIELSTNIFERREIVTKLFKDYYVDMCKTAFNITKDKMISEDIVQNVFLKLFNLDKKIVIEYPKTYLKKMIFHESIDFMRKTIKENITDIELERIHIPDEEISIDKNESIMAKINKAIDELPDKCRLIFVLKRKEGLTNQEIADEMGISIKTVENQMTKAFKVLRLKLDTIHFIFLLCFFKL
ncbi:MAG: sigma-70 family RNA polymerase sigma factor [Flavobacteriia bacterium]|nr:sigma-70 family RNA polymerase sigma factor [Flavobacteriia bacterium]